MRCETCYYYRGDKLEGGTFYPMPADGTWTVVNCNEHPKGKHLEAGRGCEDWVHPDDVWEPNNPNDPKLVLEL